MPESVVALRAKIIDVLKRGLQIDSAIDGEGNSILHILMEHDFDDENILWSVLSRCPDISMRNNFGLTQLDMAIENGNQNNLKIVQKLLAFCKHSKDFKNIKLLKGAIPRIAGFKLDSSISLKSGQYSFTDCLVLGRYQPTGLIYDDYMDWCEDTTMNYKKVMYLL